ncbi:amidohydrolase family protein [Candidatus Saccharibacteria bacterium]|nr:amidohydrolase family protein [Candidatus Saccharibacteria bacterium]
MASTITLPGLIDPHVHLRDPGQTYKEDFYTGTTAALAGGFTTIMDMPNNAEPITTLERLERKIASAKGKIVCDLGIHFGTLGDNFDEFSKVIDKVAGLKVYMNVTTGNFIVDKEKLIDIYEAWPSDKPILLHAEDDVIHLVDDAVRKTRKTTYVAHASSEEELGFVVKAKDDGLPVFCGVTPHHLFMTEDKVKTMHGYAMMKPSLKSAKDQKYLWDHMDYIDVIESDHAPHTREEKEADPPAFGVPGLETTLAMLLTAEKEGRLTRKQIVDKLHTNPAKIFNVKTDPKTKIVVEMREYEVDEKDLKTKAGWSPFAGRKVVGKVKQVDLRGNTVYKDGKVLAKKGSGKVIS